MVCVRYHDEDIMLHEASHGVHLLGACFVIPGFERRLREAYNSAMKKGLWQNHYAATNVMEYWVNVYTTSVKYLLCDILFRLENRNKGFVVHTTLKGKFSRCILQYLRSINFLEIMIYVFL